MEEIPSVSEEARQEPDPKPETIQRHVVVLKEEEEEGDGGGPGHTVDDEDSDEDFTGWDEDGVPTLPFAVSWPPPVPVCTAGASYTMEEAEEIYESVWKTNHKMLSEWADMANRNVTPLPASPLPVLSKITTFCVSGHGCYCDIGLKLLPKVAEPDHPYFKPCEMMQVFSLGLSSPVAHPVNIYGWLSVRDGWEPCRNYLFKRSRDDPAMISQDCSFLPLCSPCRGMYVMQYVLIDSELWIKEEGDGSADKLLFRGYVEINTSFSGFGSMLRRRFQGDCHGLDMHFAFLGYGIETVIEVEAEAKQPSDVRISALTSGFDKEISLYDGKFCGSGPMLKHFLAVKKHGELHVVLKMDGAPYKWTFEPGVGVVIAPEHPVSGFTQYFVMNVSFRTRGRAASAWKWSCICNNVYVSEMNP